MALLQMLDALAELRLTRGRLIGLVPYYRAQVERLKHNTWNRSRAHTHEQLRVLLNDINELARRIAVLSVEVEYERGYLNVIDCYEPVFENAPTEPDHELDLLLVREAMRVPSLKEADRKGCMRGDWLGCRKHARCRHQETWKQKPHVRTVRRERAVRSARLAHPRNCE